MKKDKSSDVDTVDLRRKAEHKFNLATKKLGELPGEKTKDIKKLVHELEVHQIELEMQNDELRKAQLKIEESRQKYFDLYNFAPVGYLTLNEQGIVLDLNLTTARLLGIDKTSLINSRFNNKIDSADRDVFYRHLAQVWEMKNEQSCDLKLLKKDGTGFHGQLTSVPIKDEKNNVLNCRTVIMDITERNLTAEKSLKMANENLRNFTIYMDTKVEEEKKKIAREIHDDLGQLLTALKINLTLLGKNITQKKKNIEKLESMNETLDLCLQIVHNITKELRPIILDDLGIIAALRTRVSDFEELSGIEINFIWHPKQFTLDPDLSLSIYRIFLEIFNNIILHAKTKKATIKFRKNKTNISLIVRDFGVGITEDQITSPISFGLLGIIERLNVWQGKMSIEGIPGRGTTIKIRIPNPNS